MDKVFVSLKTIIPFCNFFILSLNIIAQERIIIYYNNNWEITKKDKASYYREADYDLKTLKLNGLVRDYNIQGILLMEGSYISNKKNGDFIFYYANGNVKSKGKYFENNRLGLWEFYYSDNSYMQKVLFNSDGSKLRFSVVEFYDKEGNQLIIHGKGKWAIDSIRGGSLDDSSLNNLTGQFKDSLMTGVWKLRRSSDNMLIHSELFRKGNFINARIYEPIFDGYGIAKFEMLNKFPDENSPHLWMAENFIIDTTVFPGSLAKQDVETILSAITGKEYRIKQRQAMYPTGNISLFEFVGQNIFYPVSALEKGISGEVLVNVVIDSLGRTKEVKLFKGINDELDNEALRVLKLIKEWLPAIQNGQSIESIICIPVMFEIK